ncbi:sugar phosphate isomerase/epimerase family protein [Zhouia sp. PK063]|uniref:sugar phosphate isomerase/epimerase family protein n=1 Tax=Zhouia sp. PK063 TaxID=3373602 RepID=UPI00379087DC
MERRLFIRNTGQVSLAIALLGATACVDSKSKKDKKTTDNELAENPFNPFFKLSLAQWSFHSAIMEGKMDPRDFAQKSEELGFEGLEYVSQLYKGILEKEDDAEEGLKKLVATLKANAEKYHQTNLDIMIDAEGDLASNKEEERAEAINNHKKWVDAAAELGCHSIRVNLFGSTNPDDWKTASIAGLKGLCAYAKTKNINILVENHGYLSSNSELLAEVMKSVKQVYENVGTMPDFGNFCLKRQGNELWGTPCVEEYDKYKGIKEMMPYAKAVSAKSYDFDDKGDETTIDFYKMMKIVKDSGYTGFVGVEYEGEHLSEREGIIATKKLLIKVAKEIG